MFKGFYNLASGMLTQGRRLDVISNNMTNSATAGFKVDRFTSSTFQEVLWSRTGNVNKVYTDLGVQSFITAPSALYTDFTQGAFDDTGMPLDFGIEGDGFFAIDTPGGRVYTRNGSFSLDNENYLCLPGQGRVVSADGGAIQLTTDKISADGRGMIYTEEGELLGQIGIFVFEDTALLEKNDQAMFVGEGAQPGIATIHHKMLERSNADWVQQMTDMISTQRAYQSAAEATKIYDDVMTKAANEVGRL